MTRLSPQSARALSIALRLKPKRLAADTAYGTGRFLGWLVGPDRTAYSVRDASERDDGTFSASDFRWDKRHGVYMPNNKVLHTTGTVHEGNIHYAPPSSTAMFVR
jgi:hypothetical protein